MPEYELQERHLKNLVPHDETHRATHRTAKDDRVHVADMIADDHGRSLKRNVLKPGCANAIDDIDDQPCQEAHQELGQQ